MTVGSTIGSMSSIPATYRQLPLFPLNNVLFPGGMLGLQVFELRYLDMVNRRQAAGEPFGVVCLSEGHEVRLPAADVGSGDFASETLHPIGTLARIDDLQRPQPGLMLVSCTGTQRFRILNSERQKLGLWAADVELLPDDAPAAVPPDLAGVRSTLQQLLRELRGSAREANEDITLPIREPFLWNDCGWLANRWCEMLPMAAGQKQRLLALDSPVLRLELVADVLEQMGFKPPEGQ